MPKKEVEVTIDGIKNPILRIKLNNNKQIKVLIDNKEYKLYDSIILDKKYTENRINKIENKTLNKYVKIPYNSKKQELYIDNKLVLNKNVSIFSRILSRIKSIFRIIKRIPKIILKTIKLMWTRHHFIIPPRLIKQSLNSFKNNISNKNIDELFYNPLVDNDYRMWLEENKETIDYKEFSYNPLISIIIPTYNVSNKLLSECLDSVLNQTYKNFEICIADDNSTNEETINTLKKYEQKYKNIKVKYREENGHISKCSNTALSLAKGEFISLLDNDDILDKDALYYVVESLNNDKKLDLIYTDEDKLDINGKRCFPHFKPDFSYDTLLSSNYICHFTTIRKSIIDKLEGFRSEYDGAQDYDLFLRVIELTKKIHHIPKILYHWRITESSTAGSGNNKNYAYLAGKRALENYFQRNKIKAKVNLIGNPAMYEIEYLYEKEPKISIIIPTKDKASVLNTCLSSIYEKTTYKNYEIIVIDNNSEENETFKLLEEYKNKYNSFKSIRLECPFNFSYINNEAVKESTGDYIVLLNNDTEVITTNWLNIMVGYAMQDHIGCVGVKLLYPNRTIQHAGVVKGCGGIAMHAFATTGENEFGYFGRLVSVYDYSAVTAACLMIKKEKYLAVKGLDENLKVAYNDVDLCLKILEKGYNNVFLPQVKLLHYESLSRGNDMNEDQIERFKKETDYMCDKWGKDLLKDNYYNNNLSYLYAFRLDKKNIENR